MLDGRSSWRNFWDSVLRLQWDKANPWMGLRNAAGVVIPMAAGAAYGSVSMGVSAGIGALNVSFMDSTVPYAQRAKRMLAASAVVSLAVFAGAATGHHHTLTLVAGALWAFAAGLLVAVDQTAADLGTSSLVTLLVFAALPMPLEQAAMAGLLAFGGGLLQTALSVARWPIRPYAPERRALSDLFRALAKSASGSIRASEPPPSTAQSTYAQETLATLDHDRSIEAERYRAMLSQAERMRLALLALSRLRVRIERDVDANSPAIAALDRFLELTSDALRDLADERPSAPAPELRMLIDSLRPLPGPTIRDTRRQMDALAGQLRAAADLASRAVPTGAAEFARHEAAQSWRLRLKGTFATLRANLSLGSAACRHAIRLAVCVAIGQALAQALQIARPAWAPMTIAIVLKPDFGTTFSRGVLRLAGTFAGLAVATGLFHAVAINPALEIALLGVFMYVARAYGLVNYGIAATAITALVVLLLALSGVAPNTVILPRAINTVLGGAVALIVYTIWPTWERTHLGETVARMLDGYREYFHLIRYAYERAEALRSSALDRARQEARRARTNLEASVERLGSEPGTPPERMRVLGGMLANSHRLAHALMALEAGLAASRPAPPRPEFIAFAGDVEITLGKLSGALRGSRLDPAKLPDLRDRHDALLRSAEGDNARHALVNVEADRITNTLNTLTGDVLQWTRKS